MSGRRRNPRKRRHGEEREKSKFLLFEIVPRAVKEKGRRSALTYLLWQLRREGETGVN